MSVLQRANATRSSVPVIHVATSSGGHIDLLLAVRAAFDDYRTAWVAQPSIRARMLQENGERVHMLPNYDGHVLGGQFLRTVLQSARIVWKERPRLVVTAGAGSTVPFCLFTRLTGGTVIFIETMARVTSPSSSGRVLSRLASRVFVQWEELARFYPRATVCRPALLESIRSTDGIAPSGDGVFVGVGTHNQPFDRILEAVDRAVEAGILSPPIVAQSGSSNYRPRHYESRAWLQPDEVQTAIRRAEYVICHAGSGIVSSALRAGRRPMVLARLARHGEHFDDHQTQIVAKLASLGLVVQLGDEITEADLAASKRPLPRFDELLVEPSVEHALREELRSLLGSGSTVTSNPVVEAAQAVGP